MDNNEIVINYLCTFWMDDEFIDIEDSYKSEGLLGICVKGNYSTQSLFEFIEVRSQNTNGDIHKYFVSIYKPEYILSDNDTISYGEKAVLYQYTKTHWKTIIDKMHWVYNNPVNVETLQHKNPNKSIYSVKFPLKSPDYRKLPTDTTCSILSNWINWESKMMCDVGFKHVKISQDYIRCGLNGIICRTNSCTNDNAYEFFEVFSYNRKGNSYHPNHYVVSIFEPMILYDDPSNSGITKKEKELLYHFCKDNWKKIISATIDIYTGDFNHTFKNISSIIWPKRCPDYRLLSEE